MQQQMTAFRFLQFRLRTLLLVFAIVALWLGWQVRQAERQRRAAGVVRAAGGIVEYDYESTTSGWFRPAWIRGLLGGDMLHDVVSVRFDGAAMMVDQRRYEHPTDEQFGAALAALEHLPALERLELGIMLPLKDSDLSRLAALPSLRRLTIYAPQVSDAGLEQLAELKQLETLEIDYTTATDEGIERLRQALPDCEIYAN